MSHSFCRSESSLRGNWPETAIWEASRVPCGVSSTTSEKGPAESPVACAPRDLAKNALPAEVPGSLLGVDGHSYRGRHTDKSVFAPDRRSSARITVDSESGRTLLQEWRQLRSAMAMIDSEPSSVIDRRPGGVAVQ